MTHFSQFTAHIFYSAKHLVKNPKSAIAAAFKCTDAHKQPSSVTRTHTYMYKYKYTCTPKHKTPPVAQPRSLPLCCFCVEECPRPPPRSLPPRPLGIHHHVHPPLFTADTPIPLLGLLPLFCLSLCVTPSNKASCFDCTTLFFNMISNYLILSETHMQ